MGFKIEKKNKKVTLTADGDLAIGIAADLKDEIFSCLSDSEEVNIDLDGVKDIDLSCIQLLCSANQTFEKQKKVVKIGDIKSAIVNALTESGYSSSGGCPEAPCKKCLWKGEKS